MRYSIIIFAIFLISCNHSYYRLAKNYSVNNNPNATESPDYSHLDNWAAIPLKHNPSDSVPKPLRNNYFADTLADVFFIHPTTYTDASKAFGWNAPVKDALLNAKTDYSTILYQASIFNAIGRIYAPRYRQAHLSAYFPKTQADSLHALAAFNEAYNDIKKAFEFYSQHYNHGRPIIIASHSQGSTHAIRLIKEFFDGKTLQQQFVVAYVLGMPVPQHSFQNISACNSPEQTGCICSWRSFKEGYLLSYVQKEKFHAIVTNPLTWKASEPDTNRLANKGAVLRNFNAVIPHVVNAVIEKHVLWMDRPHFFCSIFLRTKNYLIAYFNFLYVNIRENVAERTKILLEKK
jgi:hypothetical protein